MGLSSLRREYTNRDGEATKGIRQLMEGIHLRGRTTTVDGTNHAVQLWSCHNGPCYEPKDLELLLHSFSCIIMSMSILAPVH